MCLRERIGSSDERRSEIKEKESHSLCFVRFGLDALRFCRGAAAEENPADRIPKWCHPLHYLDPRRGIPAGSARAWLLGGEKHCDRVAICRGKTRSAPRACGGASAPQGRLNCLSCSGTNPFCQASNCYDSHRHGV